MRLSIYGLPSIIIALAIGSFVGCGGNSGPMTGDSHAEGKGHEEHAHASEGPHHGHIIELGKEDYHLELTHDDATKNVAVYILDSGAKIAVPIDAKQLIINLVVGGKPSQYVLPAAPQASDPPGQSSCFQLADEKLCDGWDAEGATGRINIEIAGKSYAGAIEHHAHGEHSHK